MLQMLHWSRGKSQKIEGETTYQQMNDRVHIYKSFLKRKLWVFYNFYPTQDSVWDRAVVTRQLDTTE